MSKSYQYFTIPYDLIPKDPPPPYAVWFASWSTTPPVIEPGMSSPVVVGATETELPAGAIVLGYSSKDPPPPPPLLATTDLSEYQATVNQWLDLSRSADE